jgi:hypothetical protein
MTPLSDRFHDALREALAEAGINIPGLRVVERRA